MQDFPPEIRAYSARDDAAPDTRSPRHFLWWMIRLEGTLALAGVGIALVWMLPQVLGPWLVGRAIDDGIVGGDSGAFLQWVLVLLAITVVGGLSGTVYHTVIVREWLVALYGTTKLVTRKTLQLGHILPRRTPTGEVLSVSGSDSDQFGGFIEIVTRALSEVVAFLCVAAIVLTISPTMGVLVLLSAPLLVLCGMPLLRPMQRWQGIERSRNSELTSQATDIVGGLRILRGIGGENTFGGNYARQSQRVRQSGVSAGSWQAAVEAVGVLLSGIFVVALMWVGVREVINGQLSVGQLISILGYGLFLIQPMRTFVEFAQKMTRAVVSARKAIAVLEQRPPWLPPTAPQTLPHDAPITDDASGLVVTPGLLTMVVSGVPDDSAALADRLGRYLPEEQDARIALELPEDLKGRAARRERARRVIARAEQAVRDEERARQAWGVLVGDVDLGAVELPEVRSHILVSDTSPHLFAGTLRSAVDPHGRLSREAAEAALWAASADDVFDAVPGGWAGELDERGRGLSGGQRQRLVLMRALAADPEVLVLVEPTSAVDAHTEARIAARLGRARQGRTTVVMTASPLLLHHADEVVLLQDGQVTARGTHTDLLAEHSAYRSVVVRGEESATIDPPEPDDTHPETHRQMTRPAPQEVL
ncbi:ABC transporter ATP-binding protein/permease [Ornithinimicrobium faecis]|uniref:ABC transporter ATP-binding protein/permease n=1 Tax=Ornithinimicrobium faecis TaxID=2934158 RepID=A0ABY4YRP5_9MICO|nr:ABC transporter ATP-binding protein [Ornithinimicrobium sp. HY1793]USQ79449.1 ABC transporter ATP-binding protein/permease [Ornithinimicrobium sp. HY1793]